MRVVLGEPQRRQGSAYLSAFAVLVAETGVHLLGAFGVPEADQDVHLHGPRPRQEQVWCVQAPGQPLGGPEGSQRIGVPAAPQLEPPAHVVDRQPRRGLGFRNDIATWTGQSDETSPASA